MLPVKTDHLAKNNLSLDKWASSSKKNLRFTELSCQIMNNSIEYHKNIFLHILNVLCISNVSLDLV